MGLETIHHFVEVCASTLLYQRTALRLLHLHRRCIHPACLGLGWAGLG